MVLAANYSMFSDDNLPDYMGMTFRQVYITYLIISTGAGGYFAAWNILCCFKDKFKYFSWERRKKNAFRPIIIFFASFLIISILYIILLFTCKYPGNLSYDSIFQIRQLMTGSYSNHHPFYHTITIKLFITLGLKIFSDMNKAVALYHVFQILFMSMCFSMVMLTLYEMDIQMGWIIVTTIWYALMPFHIMYSFTMWKDVMFGGFVLLFLVFIFRILKKTGQNKVFNYIMFLISGLGVCLFRSNGFFAFVIIFLVFLMLFQKKERNICIMFVTVIAASFLMKHIALSNLGVSQPDIVEALSIPIQQIARVVVEYNDFTGEQRDKLSEVIDIEAIPEKYLPYISDPIKSLIREKGNQQYIPNNKFTYLKLYIQTGLRHPWTYIKAWIDETKGFWNAGYSYWKWSDAVQENEYGISRIINSESMNRYFNEYLWLFQNNHFLQLFLCIGFYVWVDLFLCFISVVKRNKTSFFMTIPILAIISSLLISTPVYAEFRYAYAVFCSLPFVIFTVFYKDSNIKKKIHR